MIGGLGALLPVLWLVALTQLPTAGVEGKLVKCGPFTLASEQCDVTVNYGDTFQLDCSSNNNTLHPLALLDSGNQANVTVCVTTKSFTATTDECHPAQQKKIEETYETKGVTFKTNSDTGWIIESKLTGSDVLFQGVCTVNGGSTGGIFNAKLQTSTTTTTTAEPSAGEGIMGSGVTSAAGLLLASLGAFLGFIFL